MGFGYGSGFMGALVWPLIWPLRPWATSGRGGGASFRCTCVCMRARPYPNPFSALFGGLRNTATDRKPGGAPRVCAPYKPAPFPISDCHQSLFDCSIQINNRIPVHPLVLTPNEIRCTCPGKVFRFFKEMKRNVRLRPKRNETKRNGNAAPGAYRKTKRNETK